MGYLGPSSICGKAARIQVLGKGKAGQKPISLASRKSVSPLHRLHLIHPPRQAREEQESQPGDRGQPSGGPVRPCESGAGDSPSLVEVQGVSRGSCMRANLLTSPPGCLGAQGRLAHKLFRDLFANYTSALRPVADTDQTLNVTLEVTLSQIIDMVHCGSTTAECAGDGVKEFGGRGLGLFTKQFFSVNINNNSY